MEYKIYVKSVKQDNFFMYFDLILLYPLTVDIGVQKNSASKKDSLNSAVISVMLHGKNNLNHTPVVIFLTLVYLYFYFVLFQYQFYTEKSITGKRTASWKLFLC